MKRLRLTVFLLTLFVSTAAYAQTSLSDVLTGDAKAEYDSAKILYGAGDFSGALLKFNSAHKRSNDPRLLWNMAACEKSLRHYARALTLVRSYAGDGSGKVSDQERAEAVELIKVLEPLTGKLRIKVSEPDAEVAIDDEVIGRSPFESPQIVDLGTRKLRVKKTGFRDEQKDVNVSESSTETEAEIVLVRIVHEGRVVVKAGTNDSITIDNNAVGVGTWSGILTTGGHTLRVTAPGMRPYQTEVLVADEQTREISVTLEKEPTKIPLWAWIGGGVLVTGGLATAGYFIFRSDPTYEGPIGNLSPGVVQASRPIRF
jgi:hypothetical protein